MENNNLLKQQHPFHLVKPSFWPLINSFASGLLVLSFVSYMQYYSFSKNLTIFSLLFIFICMCGWFLAIDREGTFEGFHTFAVQKGLAYGMILFIASEVMFFFSFFWAFFHSSMVPAIQIGGLWPPIAIDVLSAWEIPLLNTTILLGSGFFITLAHKSLILNKSRNLTLYGLGMTIWLGQIFTFLQLFEYFESNFSISDSVYGSVFFMATGFHGFHVLVGTILLIVHFFRELFRNKLTNSAHFGFTAAIWYWHFVDVVWIFLFVTIYWWGGL